MKVLLRLALGTLVFHHAVTALAASSFQGLGSRTAFIKTAGRQQQQRQQLAPWNHHASSASSAALRVSRGGAAASMMRCAETPQALFHNSLGMLAITCLVVKLLQNLQSNNTNAPSSQQLKKPDSVKFLQRRFLAVFWLLRCSDWLQGPYFYEVYSAKLLANGAHVSVALVSQLFLTGFASTAVFGPAVGRLADARGRKRATLAFTVLYGLGALSTKSPLLQVLFVGRLLSGIGTSLLHSAPESWLIGASQASEDDPDGTYLSETFGLAYAGDSIVAIAAGQIASHAAASRGPTGPFEVSALFLAMGGFLASFLWKENKAKSLNDTKPSIREAIEVVKADPKIMLVGGVQSLFEAAMYIFVLQWPPAFSAAIAKFFGESAGATPYGTIFSCFMACCLLGSTLFGQLAKKSVATEDSTAGMLLAATTAMAAATYIVTTSNSLLGLVASFFTFEACVGMYFPSIGTLRSKYVPDSHRSVIMNLFGIPLNVLVVSVFLSINYLGLGGALLISSGALAVATACMFKLRSIYKKENESTVMA
jgi:MFS family permease